MYYIIAILTSVSKEAAAPRPAVSLPLSFTYYRLSLSIFSTEKKFHLALQASALLSTLYKYIFECVPVHVRFVICAIHRFSRRPWRTSDRYRSNGILSQLSIHRVRPNRFETKRKIIKKKRQDRYRFVRIVGRVSPCLKD